MQAFLQLSKLQVINFILKLDVFLSNLGFSETALYCTNMTIMEDNLLMVTIFCNTLVWDFIFGVGAVLEGVQILPTLSCKEDVHYHCLYRKDSINSYKQLICPAVMFNQVWRFV